MAVKNLRRPVDLPFFERLGAKEMNDVVIFVPSMGDDPLNNRTVSGYAQLPVRFAVELAGAGKGVRILATGKVEQLVDDFITSPLGDAVQVTTLPDYKPNRPAAAASPLRLQSAKPQVTIYPGRPWARAAE